MNLDNKINNNCFRGIRLSDYNYVRIRNIAMSLKFANVNVAGKKTYFINNTLESKKKQMQYIRSCYDFDSNECGFVFLPWSKECWVIGNPAYEQQLIKKIKVFDNKAIINLLI